VSRFKIRLTTLAIFSMAVIATPALTPAFASAGDPPVASDSKDTKEKKTKKKSGDKGSSIDQRLIKAGYRSA
jgi:hypothetical protein